MKNTINLSLIRFYRKSSKYNLELSLELENIIVGLMLGDLFAEKNNPNSNTRLQFKQSIINKEYIEHLYFIFKDYCGSEPKITHSLEKRLEKNDTNSSIKFWTFSLPCFNKFRELFYDSSGIKFIPNNLEDILTSQGLAYWAMDDGYKSGKGFYFCTESYTLDDNHKLKNILQNKFNLECGIHKHTNGHRLYIKSKSKNLFIELIKPYIIPHFNYKFDL